MHLDDVLLLAAPTARSQAYLQALVARQLAPAQVILLGEAEPPTAASPAVHGIEPTLFWPDWRETVAITCQRAGIPLRRLPVSNVNAEAVAGALADLAPNLIIYSGFGGQIVGTPLLNLGPRFLHLHAGWLPDYRGSTTLYYALLNGEAPAVSAIFLEPQIDTGPILARRHYPRPPAGLDLDRCYDAAIRADLLVRVMQDYVKTGNLTPVAVQQPQQGETYYVIHPVLKHLAILSLENHPPD